MMLLLSIIFLIVIISAFYFNISIIYRQKKNSTIKTDFINNMTHELKTPISTIGLSSDVLLKENIKKDPERIKQYAQIIKTENNRLLSQVYL